MIEIQGNIDKKSVHQLTGFCLICGRILEIIETQGNVDNKFVYTNSK